MVGLDFETAIRCEIPILTIVLNNGVMGGYEHWLPVATEKHKVHHQGGNYSKVVQALGGTAKRIDRVKDLPSGLTRAIRETKEGRPALLEVMTRPEPVFPTAARMYQ
jgi:acetolactate synthase-1/2/3 large subunit